MNAHIRRTGQGLEGVGSVIGRGPQKQLAQQPFPFDRLTATPATRVLSQWSPATSTRGGTRGGRAGSFGSLGAGSLCHAPKASRDGRDGVGLAEVAVPVGAQRQCLEPPQVQPGPWPPFSRRLAQTVRSRLPLATVVPGPSPLSTGETRLARRRFPTGSRGGPAQPGGRVR